MACFFVLRTFRESARALLRFSGIHQDAAT